MEPTTKEIASNVLVKPESEAEEQSAASVAVIAELTDLQLALIGGGGTIGTL
jgi:hypothetical protein